MFYYYGRKKKLAKYYPVPTLNWIIEPFAGSAAYSLHEDNWQKDVLLIEKNERVYKLWSWLINIATPDDIIKMPDLNVGEKTSNFLHIVHAVAKGTFGYKNITITPIFG